MLTKRMLVCLTGLLLLIGVVSIADTAIPETPGANVGGTLTIGVSQSFKDLDPRIWTSTYDFYVIGEIFDDLITLDPDGLMPRPYVAKSWEVSEDGTELTFYLNEGIKFHNGEDLTAEDVAFTFNWIADPANGAPRGSDLIWLDEVVVIDDYICKFVTKPEYAPYAPGLVVITEHGIVPKDTVLEMGDKAFNLNPIGSGPYKFVEWRTGDRIVLERNEDYWLVYPNLDRIIYRPIQELSVMMLELEAGGIDITDNMPAQDVPRFQENPDVEVAQCPGVSYFYLFFNLSHMPSNDIRYRKAVYLSVDMDAAVDSIFKGLTGIRAYGCTSPALWSNDVEYLRDNISLKEDDEEAKRLFAELRDAGIIPKDYTTTIYTPLDPRRRQLATIIATNLQENGLNAEVQPLDWGPLLELVQRSEGDPSAANLDQCVIGTRGSSDPHRSLSFFFTPLHAQVEGADNMAFYIDLEVAELVEKGDTTLDQAERERAYIEAQRIAFGDYVHIPAYHYIVTNGVRKEVHGYIPDPLGNTYICDPFHNVWVEEG